MKKLSFLYTAALSALAIFSTSCTSEDVDPEAQGPTISISNATEVNKYVNVGEETTFSFTTAKGDKNMTDIKFRINGSVFDNTRFTINGESLEEGENYSIPNSEDAGKTYEIVMSANSEAGTESIVISVTDKDGLTASFTAKITTDVTALKTATGTVHHIDGAEDGAYDLYNNTTLNLAGTETSKDIVNTDASGATFTGAFTVGTGNGSLFVVNNSFDYDNATKTSISEAFAAGSSSSSVSPSEDDIILVKLRGMDEYAVLKVTDIETTSGSGANGKGSMSFSYKTSYLATSGAISVKDKVLAAN